VLTPAEQHEITATEVEAFLDRLVGLRLMYREGPRYLGLAVSSPAIPGEQQTNDLELAGVSVTPLRLMTLSEAG
jgi:hypothetical protein